VTHTGADDARPARRRRSIFRDDPDDRGLRDHWGDPSVATGPATAAGDVGADEGGAASSIFGEGLPDTTAADSGHPDGSAR
jgi:hypothetical protein